MAAILPGNRTGGIKGDEMAHILRRNRQSIDSNSSAGILRALKLR
jgi:hypothetical protein